MALKSALVDKARTITKVAGAKVEGTKQYSESKSEYFRVRIEIPQEAENKSEGRYERSKRPTILIAKRDRKGKLVDIQGDMELEVESRQFGTLRCQIDGTPKPIRRKRTIMGYEGVLIKVER